MLDLKNCKVYIVGGYVRDRLLRRECKDHDFVVVGATPQIMFANGFQRVGAEFPVYLAPNGDEYALARTERKTSAGYNGFETDFGPDITLEDDLMRRDLTVNAMAREVIGWNDEGHAKLSDDIIDPFNGQQDLKDGILRHVSEAFADDPVRVLRVARFAARYSFTVAPTTKELMTKLVASGELDHLVPERVWTEFEKAMGEDEPSRFFWTLMDCGAFEKLFSQLGRSLVTTGYYLRQAALLDLPVIERLMIIFSGVDISHAQQLLEALKAPSEVFRLTRKMKLMLDFIKQRDVVTEDVFELLLSIDAFGNTADLKKVSFTILTCLNIDNGNIAAILKAHREAKRISFDSLSFEQQNTLKGKQIGEAIDELRLEVIKDNWLR